MGTMTVSEAYYIVHDIVGPALLATRGGHARKPVSLLKGYDLVQICTAFNLLIANSFLLYADRDVFEEAVAEEKFAGCLKNYHVPFAALRLFVPDDQVDVLEAKPALDFDDPRFLSQETTSSFAQYCRSVGADDLLYWGKVYSRLGLEYTANSPRENDAQPPECDIDDSGIRDHFRTIVSAFADTVRSNPCYIGDCGDLPHPKKTILYAICWLREHYERRLEGADATNRAAIERYCKSLSRLLTHAVDLWHQIEPVDREAVAKLNKCASFPDWALPLKAKYIDEDAARFEAFNITDEVVGDIVACDKRRLQLLSSEAAEGGEDRIEDETRSISDQSETRPDGEREVKPESRPSAGRGPVAKFILFLVALATVVCGSIGAVWLGLLGQWRMLFVGFFGFVSSVGMPHVWLFATLLVTGPLAVVLHKYTSFSRPIAAIWTLFSVLCEGVLVACWTALVFWYFLSDAEKVAFAPALVWAYSITMAPLTYKAFRYPGLAFGGVWSLGLATTAYLFLIAFRIAAVGGTGRVAVCLAAIVLLWSFLLAGYLMSISVDSARSAETSEAPSEASLDPIRSSASTHRARRGGRVSGLRGAIRWILALPAGVLAAAIVAFPVHWFVMVNFGGWANEPLIEIRDPAELRQIELFLQSVFGPLAFVYCAARTVPRYNRLVAVLLTVAIVLGLPLFNHWWNSEGETMSTAIAYVLVVLLGHWCLTVGVYLADLPVALLLVWAPISLRTKVSGFVGGFAGVALAVAFGYGIFRLLVGPGSFTVGAFLASTVPLLYMVWRDFVHSCRVITARQQTLNAFSERGDSAVADSDIGMELVHGTVNMVVGEIAGLVLVAMWFFSR